MKAIPKPSDKFMLTQLTHFQREFSRNFCEFELYTVTFHQIVVINFHVNPHLIRDLFLSNAVTQPVLIKHSLFFVISEMHYPG